MKIELAYSTIVGSSAPTSPKPATTPKVETTTSFATKPVIVATVAAQWPKPRGAKIGAITFPTASRIEWLSSENSTNSKLVEIFCKNQITTVVSKIIVPALITKAFTLSQTVRATFHGVGKWYSGNSITKGAGSPENCCVFFNMIPDMITAIIPAK